jgi:prolyl oligopeptidase
VPERLVHFAVSVFLAGLGLVGPLFALPNSDPPNEPITTSTAKTKPSDEFSYLEDNASARTRTWVNTQNARTLSALQSDSRFDRYYDFALKSGNAPGDLKNALQGRLTIHEGRVYQLSTDSDHPRGVWRRTPLTSFLSASPKWEVLLDVDEFARRDSRPWQMYGGPDFSPNGHRCLLKFSDGSSNTFKIREFDVDKASFVEEGFLLPPKVDTQAIWRDDDTLMVSGYFGEKLDVTDADPIVVKEWSRGHALSDAREIFRSQPNDFMTIVSYLGDQYSTSPDVRRQNVRSAMIIRFLGDLRENLWQVDQSGQLKRMTLPDTVETLRSISYAGHSQYVFNMRADWKIGGRVWKAGSLYAMAASEVTHPNPRVHLLLQPDPEDSIDNDLVTIHSGFLVVGSHLGANFMWRLRVAAGNWRISRVALPQNGEIVSCMSNFKDAYVLYQSFLTPPTLYRVDADRDRATPVLASPQQFDASRFETQQWEARSADGTSVPYFITLPRSLKMDGEAPVLAVGYGAFRVSLAPIYSATLGKLWLEQGGVYVVANIRGGLARGPGWYVTGVNRQHTYDDMTAVIEDLIRRGITSPKRIGIMGYSAGGLVAGVMINQHPELFGAAILRAADLDNFRPDLGIGTAESIGDQFGSPNNPSEGAFLERTSPLENLRGVANFPVPLILTATNDQQVFPAGPRRFAAKMESLRLPFFFYEAPEGAHGGAAPGVGQAALEALMYTYLARQLVVPFPAGG